MGERTSEHWEDWKNEAKGTHIHDHMEDSHKGEEPDMKLEIVNRCKTALQRQVSETINIKFQKMKGSIVLNNKIEYNRCLLPTLAVIGQGGNVLEDKEKRRKKEVEVMIKKKYEVLAERREQSLREDKKRKDEDKEENRENIEPEKNQKVTRQRSGRQNRK